MNKKGFRKSLAITFMLLLMTIPVLYNVKVYAAAPNGILGNGTNGIYIDINAEPFTTYANKSYGHLAYTSTGCTWFAAARVNQLTGKTPEINTGKYWYNTYYASFGFTRGQSVQAKALACYEGHVAVVEKVSGDTVTVSEGGYVSAGEEYGYCKLHTMTVESLESARNGAFLGYVYLGVSDDSTAEAPDSVTGITQSLNEANGKLTISWNASNVGTNGYYEFVWMDNYWNTISTTKVTTTSITMDLERGVQYAFRIHSYNAAGNRGWGNGVWTKVWDPEIPDSVTGITQSLDETSGKLTISWNASNIGTGGYYELVWMDDYWNTLSTTKVKGTSITINLTKGVQYAFRVHAYNIAGDRGWGAGVWAKVWNPVTVEESTQTPENPTENPTEEPTQGSTQTENTTEQQETVEQTPSNGNVTKEEQLSKDDKTATIKNKKPTKVKGLQAKRKALKISWKRVKGIKGYQIEYSLYKSFKNSKKITVKKVTTTTVTIKKLKAKKKYYVRIRTYIISDGEKIYSKWSGIKSMKTK